MHVQLRWIQCRFALVSTNCLGVSFLWDTVYIYTNLNLPLRGVLLLWLRSVWLRLVGLSTSCLWVLRVDCPGPAILASLPVAVLSHDQTLSRNRWNTRRRRSVFPRPVQPTSSTRRRPFSSFIGCYIVLLPLHRLSFRTVCPVLSEHWAIVGQGLIRLTLLCSWHLVALGFPGPSMNVDLHIFAGKQPSAYILFVNRVIRSPPKSSSDACKHLKNEPIWASDFTVCYASLSPFPFWSHYTSCLPGCWSVITVVCHRYVFLPTLQHFFPAL